MDGETKVTNRTLGTLLQILVKKSIKEWDKLLFHVELAFNQAPSKATSLSAFEVVYITIQGHHWTLFLSLIQLSLVGRLKREQRKFKIFMPRLARELIHPMIKLAIKPTSIGRRFTFGPMIWYGFT